MTPEEKKELNELLDLHLKSINGKIEYQYDIIEMRLSSIDDHLKTLNGRTLKSEQKIEKINIDLNDIKHDKDFSDEKFKTYQENRIVSCPNQDRIKNLEINNLTKNEIKKFIVKSIGITGGIITIIFTIIKIITVYGI